MYVSEGMTRGKEGTRGRRTSQLAVSNGDEAGGRCAGAVEEG